MNSYSKRQTGRTEPWLQALMALIMGAMLLAAGPARAATEAITYIHGDPLAATSSAGAVVWKECYTAHPQVRNRQGHGTDDKLRLRGGQTKWDSYFAGMNSIIHSCPIKSKKIACLSSKST